MATGLLRPDAGQVFVLGHDVWGDPVAAKQLLGILPDGLRVFDRLTGLQLIVYAGPAPRAVPRGGDGPSRRAAPGPRADRGSGQARRRLLGRHDEEDHPGDRPRPRAACPRPRRALRGGGPGLRGDDPRHPGGLRRRGRHGHPLEPRHGPRRADLHPRRRDLRRPRPRAGHRGRGAAGGSLEQRFVDLVGGSIEVEGLAWLRTSSD